MRGGSSEKHEHIKSLLANCLLKSLLGTSFLFCDYIPSSQLNNIRILHHHRHRAVFGTLALLCVELPKVMSSTGVFGDPPAGMDLSENQDSAVINAVVTLMVIATVFVVLRIVARIIEKGEGLAFDDYLVMLGLVCLSIFYVPPRKILIS